MRIAGINLRETLLDRAISYLDPLRGARRMHARAAMAIAGGYTGGRRDRAATKKWNLGTNSADVDTLTDLSTLRDRSRDLVRNAPLATGAVNTVVQNVIGGGLTLGLKPDWQTLDWTENEATLWAQLGQGEFLLWAESLDCDATRTQNFYGLQELAFRSMLESGDVLILLPMIPRRLSVYDLCLQVIEGDRLANPQGLIDGGQWKTGNVVCGGVELDKNGAPLAYHILDTHPGDPHRTTSGTRVAAWAANGRRNAIHLFHRTRPGQHRGVPYLAPVIETLKQLDGYIEAELMAARLSALITLFVESEQSQDLNMPGLGGTTQDSKRDKATEVQMGTGAIIDLTPGEKISNFAPNRPNTAFDGFLQANDRKIGVALGIPYEVLVKHFTASYSAARAALLEAWTFFLQRRDFVATGLCRPILEVWMGEAVARDRVNAPGFFDQPALRRAYLLSEWTADAMPQIDQVKEVEAAKKRVDAEFSTLEDETRQLTGKSWNDVHRQRTRERQMQQADGTGAPAVAVNPGDVPQPPINPPPPENQGDLERAETL